MNINFDTKLVNFEGEILKDGVGDKQKEATLGVVCVNALMLPSPDKNEDGNTKLKKYELALKIYKGGEVNIDTEDVALIKKDVSRAFGPMVVGQVYKILEDK